MVWIYETSPARPAEHTSNSRIVPIVDVYRKGTAKKTPFKLTNQSNVADGSDPFQSPSSLARVLRERPKAAPTEATHTTGMQREKRMTNASVNDAQKYRQKAV